MRDGEIIRQFEEFSAAVAHDNRRLAELNTLLRTRIDALELVLLGGRFSLLKLVILQLFSPRLVAGMVKAQHAAKITQFNTTRRAVAEAQSKIKGIKNSLITLNGNGN